MRGQKAERERAEEWRRVREQAAAVSAAAAQLRVALAQDRPALEVTAAWVVLRQMGPHWTGHWPEGTESREEALARSTKIEGLADACIRCIDEGDEMAWLDGLDEALIYIEGMRPVAAADSQGPPPDPLPGGEGGGPPAEWAEGWRRDRERADALDRARANYINQIESNARVLSGQGNRWKLQGEMLATARGWWRRRIPIEVISSAQLRAFGESEGGKEIATLFLYYMSLDRLVQAEWARYGHQELDLLEALREAGYDGC